MSTQLEKFILGTVPLTNFTVNGAIGTALATVDIASSFSINQTTPTISLTIPTPSIPVIGQLATMINLGLAVTISGCLIPSNQVAVFSFSGVSWTTTTGASSISTIGTTPNLNGASLLNNILTLQPADISNPGVVNNTTQTFSGEKTFNSPQTLVTGRLGIGVPTFGASRLGDSDLQVNTIDTTSLNLKNVTQESISTIYAVDSQANNALTTRIKSFTRNDALLDVTGRTVNDIFIDNTGAAMAVVRDDALGKREGLDVFSQNYPTSLTDVAQAAGFVSLAEGGGLHRKVGLWFKNPGVQTYVLGWVVDATSKVMTLGKGLIFPTGVALATPPTGQVSMYAKADKRMYSKDDAGVEILLGGSSSPNVQIFIVNGTYTPTTGMRYCIVEAVGAGGGGGGCNAGSVTAIVIGGSGGGGSYARVQFTATQIGVSQTISLGGGGSGGTTTTAGGAGGNSTFGTILTVPGGFGGILGTQGSGFPVQAVSGGAGGNIPTTTGTPIVLFGGQAGNSSNGSINGTATQLMIGNGASSLMGNGGIGSGVYFSNANPGGVNGTNGLGNGSGGSGSSSSGTGALSKTGGAGTGARIIITEYFN